MDSGSILLIVLIGLLGGSLWLSLYCYSLYLIGRRIAKNRFLEKDRAKTYTFIFLASIPPGGLCLFLPIELYIRVPVAIAVWMLHVQPIVVGYWTGCQDVTKDNHRLFRKRTQDWLEEWEDSGTNTPDDRSG